MISHLSYHPRLLHHLQLALLTYLLLFGLYLLFLSFLLPISDPLLKLSLSQSSAIPSLKLPATASNYPHQPFSSARGLASQKLFHSSKSLLDSEIPPSCLLDNSLAPLLRSRVARALSRFPAGSSEAYLHCSRRPSAPLSAVANQQPHHQQEDDLPGHCSFYESVLICAASVVSETCWKETLSVLVLVSTTSL